MPKRGEKLIKPLNLLQEFRTVRRNVRQVMNECRQIRFKLSSYYPHLKLKKFFSNHGKSLYSIILKKGDSQFFILDVSRLIKSQQLRHTMILTSEENLEFCSKVWRLDRKARLLTKSYNATCQESYHILPPEEGQILIKVFGSADSDVKMHLHSIHGIVEYATPGVKLLSKSMQCPSYFYISQKNIPTQNTEKDIFLLKEDALSSHSDSEEATDTSKPKITEL
jgi:hypothetical protein